MVGIQDNRLTVEEIESLINIVQFSLPLLARRIFLDGRSVEAPYNGTKALARLGTGDALRGSQKTQRLNLTLHGNPIIRYHFTWVYAKANGSVEQYTRAVKTVGNRKHTEPVSYEEYTALIKGFRNNYQ